MLRSIQTPTIGLMTIPCHRETMGDEALAQMGISIPPPPKVRKNVQASFSLPKIMCFHYFPQLTHESKGIQGVHQQ